MLWLVRENSTLVIIVRRHGFIAAIFLVPHDILIRGETLYCLRFLGYSFYDVMDLPLYVFVLREKLISVTVSFATWVVCDADTPKAYVAKLNVERVIAVLVPFNWSVWFQPSK